METFEEKGYLETADVWYMESGEDVLAEGGISVSDARALMLKLYSEGMDYIRMYGTSDTGRSLFFEFDSEGKILES